MNKFIVNSTRHRVESRDSLRSLDSKPSIVDNSLSEDWNINAHGFIRNDINLLLESENLNDMSYVVSKVMNLKKEDRFKGMSDKEILSSIKPRLIQSPAEMDAYLDYIQSSMNSIAKSVLSDQSNKEKVEKDDTIKFNNNDLNTDLNV